MKRFVLIVASALICSLAFARGGHDLVIVHFNDTHSHLDPEYDGTAGVLERAAFIDSLRRAEGRRNFLLLHAGDYEQGSSYFTVLRGDLETEMVNALGYDCVVPGNHEFDNGIEDLGRRASMLKCDILCANYDLSTFEVGKYVKPYTIVRKAGRRIGIIGIMCDLSAVVKRETSSRIPAFNTSEVVNKYASYLKNECKCDLVILLSHAGFRGESGINDTDIVPLTTDVDLVVGGHSHTRLREAYQAVNKNGRIVPIVQNWEWGHEAAVMRVSF